MKKIDAYKEILAVLNKHDGILSNDHSVDIGGRFKSRIQLEDISESFGIEIKKMDSGPSWIELSEYEYIGWYGEETNRTISCSDDGEQPLNERLYVIKFPTGPYIFGDSYPQNTFRMFFDELKSYKPKYLDTMNKSLYFTSDNAKNIHKLFSSILKKYKGLVNEEVKAERIKALEADLEKLKA